MKKAAHGTLQKQPRAQAEYSKLTKTGGCSDAERPPVFSAVSAAKGARCALPAAAGCADLLGRGAAAAKDGLRQSVLLGQIVLYPVLQQGGRLRRSVRTAVKCGGFLQQYLRHINIYYI